MCQPYRAIWTKGRQPDFTLQKRAVMMMVPVVGKQLRHAAPEIAYLPLRLSKSLPAGSCFSVPKRIQQGVLRELVVGLPGRSDCAAAGGIKHL